MAESLTILVGLLIVHESCSCVQAAVYLGVVARALGGKPQSGLEEWRPLNGEVETEVEVTHERPPRAKLEERNRGNLLRLRSASVCEE